MVNYPKGPLAPTIARIHSHNFIRNYEDNYDELTTPGSEIYERVVHNFSIWGWCQIDPATCAVARLIFLEINGKNDDDFAIKLHDIINTKKPLDYEIFDKLCEIAFGILEEKYVIIWKQDEE
jgi:hypothetical protein